MLSHKAQNIEEGCQLCVCVCVLQSHWGSRLSKRLLLETAVSPSTHFAIIVMGMVCWRHGDGLNVS